MGILVRLVQEWNDGDLLDILKGDAVLKRHATRTARAHQPTHRISTVSVVMVIPITLAVSSRSAKHKQVTHR